MAEKLSRKRKAFCFEFVIDRNATQAAIRAGYSPKSAASQGCRLMKLPIIADKIDELDGYIEMNAIEAQRRIGKMAREATSESVKLRALERITDIHGLTKQQVEGDLIVRVLYGNRDTPERTNGEADTNPESPSETEGHQ
jgi:phage terminase small subunit